MRVILKSNNGRRGLSFALLIGLALFVLSTYAHAEYPDRVIKSIVPFTPGGGTDIFARVIAPYLGKALDQRIVVANKPGAAGNIGMDSVAKSKPDGYTILFVSSAAVVNPAMYKKMPYDPIKDIQPVAMLSEYPNMVVVNVTKVPVKTLREFVELVRKNPGKFNASAGGLGTRLPAERFRLMNNLEYVIVQYKGAGDAVTAMLSGETDFIIVNAPAVAPHIASGKFRALAVASEQRLPDFSDVPTTKEAGMPEFIHKSFFGVYAPGGTPPEIVRKLNETLNSITAMPEVIERLRALGAAPTQYTPEGFTDIYRKEIARLKDLVKRAKIPMR
jgi:tripartite-type tricarboxylate transporter receptor subunit TctC